MRVLLDTHRTAVTTGDIQSDRCKTHCILSHNNTGIKMTVSERQGVR